MHGGMNADWARECETFLYFPAESSQSRGNLLKLLREADEFVPIAGW
jgi:hypothetical protein